MGISVVFSEHQIAVHLFSKMKAFVAAPAPAVTVAAAAPAVVPTLAYNYINPYDYAGQVYPVAEPYIHEEIPAEEYVHTEIEAEPYVHTEIAAEPYVHTEIAAEPYVHEEIA